jgi:3-hydroxyacyl-CoA dehydrogenase / enoyl-CoA hydratase / 3-hydroxybutyryl-CoA epimerase
MSGVTTAVQDDVLVVTINQPGDAVNKVDRALGAELERVLETIGRDRAIRGAVIMSGKPDIFIAGADIEQFLEFRVPADAEAASRFGQQLLNALERARVPVVAAIHGACLGGGLELALACRYRICTDHPKTVLGLPEVQLGLIPGMGGTQRLPRLIGASNALDMILTGRNVRGRKALQLGLVDELVHPAILRDIAVRRADELAKGSLKPSRRGARGVVGAALDGNPIGRTLVYRKAREGVMAKTRGHYPAPLAAIEVVKHGLANGMEQGLQEEARVFGRTRRNRASWCSSFSPPPPSRRTSAWRTHRWTAAGATCARSECWEPGSWAPALRALRCSRERWFGSRTPTPRGWERGSRRCATSSGSGSLASRSPVSSSTT